MLDALSATAEVRKIQLPAIQGIVRDTATRAAEMEAYATVDARFREYLETYYAPNHSTESHGILWAAAKKWGEHNGYREMEILYEDYAELNDEELKSFKY